MIVLRQGRKIPLRIGDAIRFTPQPQFMSSTAIRKVDQNPTEKAAPPLEEVARKVQVEQPIVDVFGKTQSELFPARPSSEEILDRVGHMMSAEPHHLHVYATKHNTHITLTTPDRNPIISKSAGNIGFRKAARGSYDAAYQLSAYVLGQIYEGGTLGDIQRLEVVLRGFGIGREAVTKALMGVEGRRIRDKIIRVSDATRLKFGGTRSKKPRRLG